jgi:signal transduction histidine kinase/CheY-like chemotaxis protein
MTITHRLWITLGITVFVLSCNIVLTYVLVDKSNDDLAQIVNVDRPLEGSVVEMETNIRTGFQEIVSYINDEDELHLINLHAKHSEFERYADRFTQLHSSATGQQLAIRLSGDYQEFRTIADEITQLVGNRSQFNRSFHESLRDIEDLLDGGDKRNRRQSSVAAEINIQVHAAGAALNYYMIQPTEETKQRLLDRKREFSQLIRRYGATSTKPESRRSADEISERFTAGVAARNEVVSLTDRLQTRLARLRTVVSRVVTDLDDLKRALIDSNISNVAGVEQSLSFYLIFATVMTILIFLLVGGAVYITTVSINRGIGKLLLSTYRIKRDEPNQRIDTDSKDEFGLLAAAFNEMIEFRNHAELERNRIEALLLHSQKMEAVGQLAGGVAHDFNNILTVIMGNVELIMDEVEQKLGRDKILTMLQKVEDSANQAAMLTQQLLVFTRRDVIKLTTFDLNETLREVQKILQRLVPEPIVTKIDLSAEILPIYADPGQVTQVIVNLAVNASEAMPDGGLLTIETGNVDLNESYVNLHADAHVGQHVRLSVSDTGYGMNEETQKHIFEPFFTTKPVGQGSGLGLATVYGIVVDKCNGHIVFESEEGRGSSIQVYFPAMTATQGQEGEAEHTSTSTGSNHTILICEDDKWVRELMVSILSISGYTVIAAEKPSQALKLAAEQKSPVQLLVTDVVMSEMNGKELADILTELHPDLKTIFTSGYTSDVVGATGTPSEDVEFLEKPFTRDTLLATVGRVLNRQPYQRLAS